VPTYTFTFKCVDVDGRVAYHTDSITANDPPSEAGVITLLNRTVAATGETVPGTSRTVSASLTLGSDLRLSTSDGFVSAAEWGIGVTAADYEVRVTAIGDATFDGPALGTWHPLSTDRTWSDSFTSAFAGSQSTQLLVEIRDVATETLQASATFTYTLRVTETAAAVRLTGGAYSASGVSFGFPAAEAGVTVALDSSGILRIFEADNSAPAVVIEPVNEWGRSLVASNYEVRFDVVVDDPRVEFSAFPAFGVWGNLGVNRSVQALLRNTGTGEITVTGVAMSVSIRPVGGATVASATYTANLTAVRYPDGGLP